jgi:FkbM family methyltransferase
LNIETLTKALGIAVISIAVRAALEVSMVSVAIKHVFAGTRAGLYLRDIRDRFQFFETLLRRPEEVGNLANNRIFHTLVTRLVQPHRSFIDVGAHVGCIVGEVRHFCPTVKIHAFEPIPEKASRLERSFPDINVQQYAISEHSGETEFFIDDRESAYSSLSAEMLPKDHESRRIIVQMRSIDSLSLPADIDAIKIDVEGAEEGVIRGAQRLLRETRPIIYFESACGTIKHLGYTKTSLWRAVRDSGYSIHFPNRVAHNDAGLSLEMFLSSHEYPRFTDNYVAIPHERRDEYRLRARHILRLGN